MVHPLKAKHSITKNALKRFALDKGAKRIDDVFLFIDELYAQNTFDAAMIALQSIHETDSWRSFYWEQHLNPAGLGITYSGQDSHTWTDGVHAARAVLAHHSAYVGIPTTYESYDPFFANVRKANFYGTVVNWEDYGKGKWAVDPQYVEGILKYVPIVSALQGDVMITKPTIYDKWLHVAQSGYGAVERRYINRFGMAPKIIVVHIQEGTNLGSWQHFHNVLASSTVLIGKNGDIWRLVPEKDSPWTNGDVQNPSLRGIALINQYGADPNVVTLSIESEGVTTEYPKTQALVNSVVWQIVTWMKAYNIPIENVIRHADINSVTRPNCPGNLFFQEVIAKVKLEIATEVPSTPSYAKQSPIMDGTKKWDGTKDLTIGTTTFYGEIVKVKTAKEASVHTFAGKASAQTRAPLAANKGFQAIGWTRGEKVSGDDRWWITESHSRIAAADCTTKPTEKVDEGEQLGDAPEGTILYKGAVYYPILSNDDDHELTVTRSANLREDATTKSKVVGKVKQGDKVKIAYWTFGERVNNELIWWVLDQGDNPITDGPRLWVAATSGRPE